MTLRDSERIQGESLVFHTDARNHGEDMGGEQRYRQLVHSLPAAVYTCDREGRLTLYNDAAAVLWGRQPTLIADRWCGSPRIFHPDGRPWPLDECPMALALQQGHSIRGEEIVIERPDGTRRIVLAHPEPIRDDTGRIVGGINMLVDVTESRFAQVELREIRDDLAQRVEALTRLHALSMQLAGPLDLPASLHAILDTLVELHKADHGLISFFEPDRGCLVVAASAGFDVSARQELEGTLQFVTTGLRAGTLGTGTRRIVEDIQAGEASRADLALARAAGFRAVHSTPFFMASGQVLGVLSVHFAHPRTPTHAEQQFADLCARKASNAIERARIHQAMFESEARFRHMADNAPVLIWVHSVEGCEFVNREYLRFVGGTMDDLRGMKWCDFIHPEDAANYLRAYQHALDLKEPFEAQFRLRRADGEYRWLRSTGVPRGGIDGFQGYVGCSVDITEITRSQELLHKAARRKDEFLATLAHELRNPLAPIRSALRVLRLSGGPSDQDHVHAILDRQVDHMVRLVEDLMEVSRITRGKFELRRERVDVSTIVNIAIETSQPLIERARHHLSVSLPETSPALHADAVRLVQVFANLLSNAAKYTVDGGSIWLNAECQNDDVVISVRDNGIGMAPETLARIFDLFVQGSDAVGTSKDGLGIGLTLVRRIVEMHGGRVSASSDGPGRGSTFVVSLPVASNDVERVGPDVADKGAGALIDRRVLVVDDHRDGADSLGMMLAMLGATTSVAYDGPTALDRLSVFNPDVVLLDIGMPVMNGYEVARQVRQVPRHREVLLIALTGWGQDEDRRRSLEAGFDFHLVKPLETDTLRTVLASADLLRGRHEQGATC